MGLKGAVCGLGFFLLYFFLPLLLFERCAVSPSYFISSEVQGFGGPVCSSSDLDI